MLHHIGLCAVDIHVNRFAMRGQEQISMMY